MGQKNNDAVGTNYSHIFVKRGDAVSPHLALVNVSNPPTDAELDSAFGPPAELPDPFLAFVVDTVGVGDPVWLVAAIDGSWYYEQLTLAT